MAASMFMFALVIHAFGMQSACARKVLFKKVLPQATAPIPQENTLGYLLSVAEPTEVPAHSTELLPTGLQFILPSGIYARITAWEPSIVPALTIAETTIDSSKPVILTVSVTNNLNETLEIPAGTIISQLLFLEASSIAVMDQERRVLDNICDCNVNRYLKLLATTKAPFDDGILLGEAWPSWYPGR